MSLTQDAVSTSSQKRSEAFLKISTQFKLGALVTESSHPVTANLGEVAKQDIAAALELLFDVDDDVVRKYREFVASRRAGEIKDTMVRSLKFGGRIFFTGCGSTGRLSILLNSVWRNFWQRSANITRAPHSGERVVERERDRERGSFPSALATDFENRTFSVMAGGDFALIKSVEGFEDFTAFGRKQIRDLGVRAGDVVFAITEGGETSFVIGTAWEGVEAGAKVYFVYNNPDEILCQHVERSHEVIEDKRIEKINLTTGPMAIAGSTRMQATSIQLCVLLTILEMVVRELILEFGREALWRVQADQQFSPTATVPAQFLAKLKELHAKLKLPEVRAQLAWLVALEESVYRNGHKNNYFADRFGIDVLTDTTERSPTYCTPPFRKADDKTAAESWAFLFLPQKETPEAWRHILKRQPRCVEWNETEIRELLEGRAGSPQTPEVAGRKDRRDRDITPYQLPKISRAELVRFKIGLDGLNHRPLGAGDSAVAIVSEREKELLLSPDGFYRVQLEAAQKAGAKTGLIYFGRENSIREIRRAIQNLELVGRNSVEPKKLEVRAREALAPPCAMAFIPLPETDFLLNGVTRVAVKLVMNALSTCTMVRLGRVMGNTMVWVVPSNLKLIDRATRYIAQLTGLAYEGANGLLFEVIEYVEPRMKSDQAYPPLVGMAVLRARHGLTNEEAEERLAK
jgi:N-acetylmuramic acid 6-phosphate etherase